MTALVHIDERATALTTRRYDRIAAIYDTLESVMDLRARDWRRDLWSRVEDGKATESRERSRPRIDLSQADTVPADSLGARLFLK